MEFSEKDRVHFEAAYTKGDGCWEWIGSKFQSGYGRIMMQGRTWRAHRAALLLRGVDIPDGMQACHHCDNRACVRPDHLYVGTAKQNIQDCVKRGRQRYARRTHCKNGHPLTGQNVYVCHEVRSDGTAYVYRKCRTCGRDNKYRTHKLKNPTAPKRGRYGAQPTWIRT